MAMLNARDKLRREIYQCSEGGGTWEELYQILTTGDEVTKDLEVQWKRRKQCSQLTGKLNVLRTG
jgi:hypothetical protein